MTARERARSWAQQPPWAGYLLIALLGAAGSYFFIFSQFQTYDDSGHLSASLISFLKGDALYETTYSQYGPFYFELFGGFFKATGIAVNTDSVRLITLAFGVVIGTGYGLFAEALTGDRRIGLIAQSLTFGALILLAFEPIHPIGLTTLLVLAIAFATLRAGVVKGALVLGVTAGLLLMVKINMGALALAAIVPAAGIALAAGARARYVRAAGIALALLAPTILLSTKLGEHSVLKVLIMQLAAIGAICIKAWALPVADRDEEPRLWPWLGRFAAGVVITVAAVAVVIMALGTSPRALIEGVLVDPTRHPNIDVSPLMLPTSVILLSVAAIAAAAASVFYGRATQLPLLLRAAIRLVAAIAVFVVVVSQPLVWIGPWSDQIAIGAVVAWLAATAPSGLPEKRGPALVRLILVLLAVMEKLQAYPTAGTQLAAAQLGLLPVGVLLLSDSLRLAQLWQDSAIAAHRKAAQQIKTVVVVAILAAAVVVGVLRPLESGRRNYTAAQPSGLPGAGLLRLPAAQADIYRRIVRATRGCSRLVTLPGMYSFNVWSGHPPGDSNNVSDWMLLVSPERQRHMIAAVEKDPNICVLRNQSLIDFHLGRSEPPDHPLPFVEYLSGTPLQADPSVAGTTGDYVLLRRTAAERRRLQQQR